MEFTRAFKKMALEDVRRSRRAEGRSGQPNGIALFMVIAAISVLSILVTEFVYVAQLNQKLAFDGLDQLKAHYIAKSALKISLLRLKAYGIVKQVIGGATGGKGSAAAGAASSVVPQSVLDKIWSFPLIYPIPTEIPGLTLGQKEAIGKFQKDSSLDGSFTSLIESESQRLNLNMILASYAASPSPVPSASSSSGPEGTPSATPVPTPNPSASGGFNADSARQSLQAHFQSILQHRFDTDQPFQQEYGDFRMDDFMDNLVAWADPSYQRKQSDMPTGFKDSVPFKQAPFYHVSELHMLPGLPQVDDELYNLFEPTLTVSRTAGININTMQEAMLRAIVPQMTDDEITDFFKFRDSQEEDNTFKDADSFYKYLSNSVNAFHNNDTALSKFKEDLGSRGIQLVTTESEFKITVRATVNQAVRTLEAWVTLEPTSTNPQTSPSSTPTPSPSASPSVTPQAGEPDQPPDPGVKINFMRIT